MTGLSDRLTEADVLRCLDPQVLVGAIELAFRTRYPAVAIPPRTQVQLANGIFLAMSCYDATGPVLGMKLVQVLDRASKAREDWLGGGRVQATYLLLDAETAAPRLTIEANYLTDLRTAATTAVATRFLARSDASTLGIFGTGRLARTHLRVLPLVRNFRRVLVCGRNPARSAEFVQQENLGIPGIEIMAADARTCAAKADVICACTSSSEPLFDGRDLRAGGHVNLMGAFQPHTREADTLTIQRSRVFVDSYHAAKSEMGELLIPQKEGEIADDHVAGDLHELVSGKRKGRQSAEEVTVFKSVGCALEDLVAAELLLARSADGKSKS